MDGKGDAAGMSCGINGVDDLFIGLSTALRRGNARSFSCITHWHVCVCHWTAIEQQRYFPFICYWVFCQPPLYQRLIGIAAWRSEANVGRMTRSHGRLA